MASPQKQANSGSGSGSDLGPTAIDDLKRKRMESNRLSAQRSRMRKQKQMEDLIDQATQLKSANSELVSRINATQQRYMEVESRNNVLQAQLMELTDRLRSLNSVLQIVEEVSGLALDIPEIPEPMMNQPWLVPVPFQPISANVNMFQC